METRTRYELVVPDSDWDNEFRFADIMKKIHDKEFDLSLRLYYHHALKKRCWSEVRYEHGHWKINIRNLHPDVDEKANIYDTISKWCRCIGVEE